MLKVYEKIKGFIKENYKFLIGYFIILTICLWPLPFYIYTGGGIIDLDKRVSVENENKEKGSFNLAYVRNIKATIPTYLLSYLFDWDVESIDDYKLNNEESNSDIWKREKLYLQESIDNAIINAYKLAGEEININKEVYKIISFDKDAQTDLLIDDTLLKINNNDIHNYDDIRRIINSYNYGDKLDILVLRDNQEVHCYAKIIENDNQKKMGVYLIKTFDYDYDREIKLNFSNREGGSSGGFMLSLAIYNRLIDKDLTNGLKIVGTGTIDSEGNVGSIGGVKYKLKGAVQKKADIFFVPSGENYEDAKAELIKHHYKIELVKVDTLSDAIKYLESR